MTVFDSGPTAGSVPDLELMLEEFYRLRSLNSHGIPSREVLETLNLKDLCELLRERQKKA